MNDDLVKALEANSDHYVCVIMVNGRTYIRTSIEGFEEKAIMATELEEEIEKINGSM